MVIPGVAYVDGGNTWHFSVNGLFMLCGLPIKRDWGWTSTSSMGVVRDFCPECWAKRDQVPAPDPKVQNMLDYISDTLKGFSL